MTNAIEAAIEVYCTSRSDSALLALDMALVRNSVLVPTSTELTEIETGGYEVPVICMRTTAGDGAIPAFTTLEQLLKWQPEGCKYIEVNGKALLQMAIGMPEISRIVINVDGAPRGVIPRSEFERLVALGS
jgi:hypothetical protein